MHAGGSGDHFRPEAPKLRRLQTRPSGHIAEVSPRETWSETTQQALSAAADQMRAVLTNAREPAFADLKIEVPLNTIVLRRTTPNEQTDRLPQQVAKQSGVRLKLRTAPRSEAAAQRLGARLAKDNRTWRELGFAVNGAHATGSGGNRRGERRRGGGSSSLADEADIHSVEFDDGAPLIGTR